MVTAPFAVAVHNGRDVTADPPRTQVWALLYAQVRQADNLDFRNILLDDRILDWRVRIERGIPQDWITRYTEKERATLKEIAVANFRDDVDYAKYRRTLTLNDATVVNRDATKYGTCIWTNAEVSQLLARFGLPQGSPLSVLCVEILPHITSVYEHVSGLDTRHVQTGFRDRVGGDSFPSDVQVQKEVSTQALLSDAFARPRPLTTQLGQYRILRTSPLAEVPAVCCPDC